MSRHILGLLAGATLWACGGNGSEDATDDEPGLVDTGGVCDTGARQTWETFGQGFVVAHCQGCHASTAVDRFGAPPSVVFDTEEDVVSQAERVLARAAGDDADMPPAGGPSDDDRVRLRRWLLCE